MSDRRERERQALELVRELIDADPERQRERLAALEAEDSQLAARVAELLAAERDVEADAFLEPQSLESLRGEMIAAPSPTDEAELPNRIGHYRILEELGRGGMAIVYRAERDDGIYDQRVALKILRHGLFGEDAALRFKRERQILATLEHPLIARLLDGGVADDGRPYLVMELVEGLPIDAYVREAALPLRQRLELVADVCEAVAHAHRRLVVHRDLKPSNIVVGSDGDVHLLDFGIAKLLATDEAALDGSETRAEVRLLTPSYASPEQVLGEPVDTTSDVYQLGLLLYQLLTDQRAYEATGQSVAELERIVCRDDPPRPSSVVATPRLRKGLSGELDAIVGKALQKEPDRRYASATAMSEDLRRYLRGLPVRARRPTARYVAGKFLRRHRVASAATLLIAASLVLGLAGTFWQAQQAAAERDRAKEEAQRANAIKDYLLDLFRDARPESQQSDDLTVVELLERGRDRVEERFADESDLQADMLDVIGEVQAQMGQLEQAIAALERSLELRRADATTAPLDLARTQNQLGSVYGRVRRFSDALAMFQASYEIVRRERPEERALQASRLQNIGSILTNMARFDDAESALVESLDGFRAQLGDESPHTLGAAIALADHYRSRGQFEKAAEQLEQSVAVLRGLDFQARLGAALFSLGTAYHQLERFDRAEACYRESLAVKEQVYGPAHIHVAAVVSNLGQLMVRVDRLEEAEALLREAITIRRGPSGDGYPGVSSLNNLGQLLVRLERLVDAETVMTEAQQLALRHYPPDHPRHAHVAVGWALLNQARGRHEEAIERFSEAAALFGDKYPADHPSIVSCEAGIEESREALARAKG